MEDVIVRVITLPVNVRAFTLPDEQGDYNIYLNCSLSVEEQKKSLLHERRHIENGDFYKNEPVSLIERRVSGGNGAD